MTTNELKEYVLLMLGAPVFTVDLTEDELNFCVSSALDIAGKVSDYIEYADLCKQGSFYLGRYIVAKKRFKRYQNNFMMTPEEDGFSAMTQADSDWINFTYEVEEVLLRHTTH